VFLGGAGAVVLRINCERDPEHPAPLRTVERRGGKGY
jgi:hypothetical protein